nr:MAG TPA: protein of unknown function (DUF4525) [Caudoviricetes sp.]
MISPCVILQGFGELTPAAPSSCQSSFSFFLLLFGVVVSLSWLYYTICIA